MTDNSKPFDRTDRESQLHRALVEQSLDLITVLDNQGFIVFENATVERVLGYSRGALLGSNVFNLIHPEDVARVRWVFESGWRTPGPTALVDFRIRHRNGSWRVLESFGSRLDFADGLQLGLVNSRDITDHRGLQDQVRHAQRLGTLGRFVGSIVHEFQNALQLILANLDVLLETPAANQFGDELRDIRAAAEIARSFSRQLLDLSRPNAAPPQPIDVNAAIENICKLLGPLVGSHVEIATSLHAGDAMILAHAGSIDQILVNLASNARDAMPRGGTLKIATRNTAWPKPEIGSHRLRAVAIEVTDNGLGMTEDVRSRIFEPFFSTKEPSKGTGLGMSTVWSIVHQAGGTIDIHSRPGDGSTFTIYWPVLERRTRP